MGNLQQCLFTKHVGELHKAAFWKFPTYIVNGYIMEMARKMSQTCMLLLDMVIFSV